MTQLRLLGPIAIGRVVGDGPGLGLGGTKQRGLLTLLALSAPRPVAMDRLIDALWAHTPPVSARNAVQVYVTGLRKVLAPWGFVIERTGDSYALRGDGGTDVAQFEFLAARGRAALLTDNSDGALECLTQAIDLWSGPPLDGLAELPFSANARAALEDARVSVLLDLADAQLQLGQCTDATANSRQVLTERPYDERAWIVHITALYRDGRQDEALRACRRVRRVLAEDLGVDPVPTLEALENQVLNHTVPDTIPRARRPEEPTQLPTLPTLPVPFVGRTNLISHLSSTIDGGARLVTLTGLGGMGKTTVAVALTRKRQAQSTRRIAFCEMEAEVTSRGALSRACRDVGVDPEGDPVGALAGADLDLLVLDNAEQVAGLAQDVDRLLLAQPGLSILVTSRRPLGCPGEHVVVVPGLGVAPEGDREGSESFTLFVAAAQRAGATFDPDQSLDTVSRLCRMLDGIPLAIELAASRTGAVTPGQLLTRLDSRRASTLDGRPGPGIPARPRQASLATILDEAATALRDPPRRLLESLGSFDGWTSLELLDEVAHEHVGADVFDAVDELVAGGLAVTDGNGRIRLRPPIREFAHALGPRTELDEAMVAGALALAQRTANELSGRGAASAVALLRRDEDALSAALTLVVAGQSGSQAGEFVRCLHRFWFLSGQLSEGRHHVQAATALLGHDEKLSAHLAILDGTFAAYTRDPDAPELLRTALDGAAVACLPVDRVLVNGWCSLAALDTQAGNHAVAWESVSRAHRLAASSSDERLLALVRDVEGFVACYTSDHERALQASLDGIEEARRWGDDYDRISLMVSAMDSLTQLERVDEALALSEEALVLLSDMDAGVLAATVLMMRGLSLALSGQVAQASGALTETLRLTRDRFPDPVRMADVLFTLGGCAAIQKQDSTAARRFGAATGIYQDNHVSIEGRLPMAILELMNECRERMGDSFRTASSVGRGDPDRTISVIVDQR